MAEQEISLTTIYALLQDHTAHMAVQDITLGTINASMQDHTAHMAVQDITLGTINASMQDHTARFDRMESVQNSIALRLISVETTVKEHSVMLQSMQVRLDSLHGLVEKLERRTGRIEQEYVMITEALRRLEIRFDTIEAERLRERIAALEARVQALETA